MRYVAFDVETPNSRNNRISSIGLVVIEGGAVIGKYSALVNPETHFDPFNSRLTGITPAKVANAPTFSVVWQRIGPVMTDPATVLLAHNAAFDLRVLADCVADMGLSCPQVLPYACTCQMARSFYPALPDHKLDTMCRHFSLPLDHHKADSDAMACAGLLLAYAREGRAVERFHRLYDLRRKRTCAGSRNTAAPMEELAAADRKKL